MNEEIMNAVEFEEVEKVIVPDECPGSGNGSGKFVLIGAAIVGAAIVAYKLGKKAWVKRHSEPKEIEVTYTEVASEDCNEDNE